ncbi:TPA: hypothetical protein DIS57_01465 [Candidatus Wolfebacteria bacterium]|nr:hypothetical protein [Candidatus Wolfebacteria bacterium]
MTEERKPWYLHTLSRMDARARELCPNNALRGLGERIVAAELSGSECDTIDAELERMLRENGSQYDQMGLSFLKHFQEQVRRWPWYVTLLEQMAEYARTSGFMRNLREAGEDLRLSYMDAVEYESVVTELERMVREDQQMYRSAAVEDLICLRAQIVAQA